MVTVVPDNMKKYSCIYFKCQIKMSGTCSTHERYEKCVHNIRKLEGKRPFRKPRHSCNGNVNMDLREIECEDVGWIDWVQWQAL